MKYKKTKKAVKKKQFPLRRAFGVAMIVGGLILAFTLVYPWLYAKAMPSPVVDRQVLESRSFWLVIPEIKVDTTVLGEVSRHTLARAVAHLPGSAFPGEGGNVIIVGHHYNPATALRPKSSFGLLDMLETGDSVYVAYSGRLFIYQVAKKEVLNADDPDLYLLSETERLTLLTCAPYLHETKRLKVTALPVAEE